MRYALICFAAALLAGCASHAPVPVIERTRAPAAEARPAEVPPGHYVVKKGDTLYAIALDHGQSYRDIAAWNNLEDPNRINVGQQLRVVPPDASTASAPVVVTKPVQLPGGESRPATTTSPNTEAFKREPKAGKQPYSDEAWAKAQQSPAMAPIVIPPKPVDAPSADKPPTPAPSPASPDEIAWAWPYGGKLLAPFSESSNKGVDLAGKPGDAVLAAAAGKVVYAGTGLRGYGKLVIVKHDATFLSAYAHNSQILVKEGQAVARGQKIAEVGSTDAEQPMLHFEIRRQGKPVDPQQYLPKR